MRAQVQAVVYPEVIWEYASSETARCPQAAFGRSAPFLPARRFLRNGIAATRLRSHNRTARTEEPVAENFAAEQQQWANLCKELRERQEAELRCQFLEHGFFARGRVQEWQRARAAVGIPV